MITEKELKECELVHDHGGVCWVMVENFDDDYCRIASLSTDKVDNRAYLAWKKKLKPMGQLVNKPAEALDALTNMRNALLAGTKKVVQTHIVNA